MKVPIAASVALALSLPGLQAAEIHDAARLGDLSQLERLVKAGSAIDEPDAPVGFTAWQVAKIHGRDEAAAILEKAGANTQAAFPDPATVIDKVVANATKDAGPGFAVLVARDGKVLFEEGYGLADVASSTAITPATVFRIGSITKQFTATTVLFCEQEGKLQLTDSLDRYFPEVTEGKRIQVEQLLTHRSGLKNYTSLPGFMSHVTSAASPQRVIDSFKSLSLDFEPGTKYDYCNSGYFLLGELVKKVGGESSEDLLRRKIFIKERMFSTGSHRPELALAYEAQGYAPKGGKWGPAVNWHMSWAGGAGDFYSTVGDLYRWNEALFNGRVLSPEALKRAFTPGGGKPLPKGEEGESLDAKYGYGWVADQDRGLAKIWHSGGLHGFSSQLVRYPDQKLTVVVLANSMEGIGGLSTSSLADLMARQYLWREMKSQPSFRELPLPEGVKLVDFTGTFDFSMLGVMRFRVVKERLEGRLATQGWAPVRYHGKDEFRNDSVDATFTFQRNEQGAIHGVKLKQRGAVLEGEKFDEPTEGKVPAETMAPIAGTYELPFGKFQFRVDAKSGQLRGRVVGQPEFPYFPIKGDEARYFCKAVRAQVVFVRDGEAKEGPVTGMIFQQGVAMVPGKKVAASGEK